MDTKSPEHAHSQSGKPIEGNADINLRILLEAFDTLPDATFLFNEHRLLIGLNQLALSLSENGQPIEFGTTRCCDMFWRVEGANECIVERAVTNRSAVEIEVMTGPQFDRSTVLKVRPLRTGKGKVAVLYDKG